MRFFLQKKKTELEVVLKASSFQTKTVIDLRKE